MSARVLVLRNMRLPTFCLYSVCSAWSWHGPCMRGRLQPVFAIGNPLGLERTLTQGVISTTQRNFSGLTYVQTDTPINPGNSGGPLFNTRGEVIGITNMGIVGGEALGFAIPARYVKDFVRNREAFTYDRSNPNSGHIYHEPPTRRLPGGPAILDDDTAGS